MSRETSNLEKIKMDDEERRENLSEETNGR